jgi:1-acyl-sn-glycerol-3-phosphate acyltransferase
MPYRAIKSAEEIAQQPVAKRALNIFRVLGTYHGHKAQPLENIPEGGCLIVVNHSIATYDMGLLGLRIYQHSGRVPRSLGDRAIFQTPAIGRLADLIGMVQGSPELAKELLQKGEIVMVAPGGMREALRPSSQAYELSWLDRKGFAKLAVQAQVPIILAACPKADDIFTVYDNQVTRAIYQRYRLPVPMLRGIGLSVIPRPVRLIHWLSKPIQPPKLDEANEEILDQFHTELTAQMEKMMRVGARRQL